MFKSSIIPENTVVTYTALSGKETNLSTATSFHVSNDLSGKGNTSKVDIPSQSLVPSLGHQKESPMYLEQLRNKDHPYFKERLQYVDQPQQNLVRGNCIGFESSFPSPPQEYSQNIDDEQINKSTSAK